MSNVASTIQARLRLGIPDKATVTFAGVLTLVYALAVGYFDFVDVYHRHFFENQYSVFYNVMRSLFAGYLFWIVYYTGYLAIALIRRSTGDLPLSLLERATAGFFVGAVIWTMAMLVLGYAHLYYRLVAVAVTVPIVAVSARHFAETFAQVRTRVRSFHRTAGLFDRVAVGTMFGLCVAFGLLLLAVKGLFPAGGHDYYTHYFYFYSTVVDHHSIWPNEVWYHYYYSKAMGLFFLGMLLTDPLAPSLVTFCFAVAAATCLFSMVRSVRPATLWPWAAVILYFALYIPTFGTGVYQANGGWGDFQKPHEVNAAFLVAILWASTRFLAAQDDARRIWWWCCALCLFAIAFVLTISSAIAGLFVLLMMFYLMARGKRDDARAFFQLGVVAAGGLATVLLLNYATTGMPLDVGINFFWPILDLRRLNDWGVILEVTAAAYKRTDGWSHHMPLFSADTALFINNVIRSDLLLGLFACTAAGAIASIIGRLAVLGRSGWRDAQARPGDFAAAFVPVLLFILASGIFAATAGVSEAVSFVRYASFTLPVLIAAAMLTWQLITLPVGTGVRGRPVVQHVVVAVVTIASLVHAYGYDGPTNPPERHDRLAKIIPDALRFVGGRFSIYDGYKNQAGWPARMPWGAVHPGMLGVWKEIGPGPRIWSLYVWSYCMLPDCHVDGFGHFRLSPRAPEVYWGAPDQARDVLRSAGLDYVFVSWDMQVRDPLPCTTLFSPDHIADYLGVRWTDGTSTLLTWLGPGVARLSPEWIAKYRAHAGDAISYARCDDSSLWAGGRKVHEQVMQGKRWGAEVALPWGPSAKSPW
jgi:hypothetical protein